jgi:hypothetical protein
MLMNLKLKMNNLKNVSELIDYTMYSDNIQINMQFLLKCI